MITFAAAQFAEGLTLKFAQGTEEELCFKPRFFSATAGRKFDRIIQGCEEGKLDTVHAFVERATGAVYKSAGWARPALGVRYNTIDEAIEAADLYGSYLYR